MHRRYARGHRTRRTLCGAPAAHQRGEQHDQRNDGVAEQRRIVPDEHLLPSGADDAGDEREPTEAGDGLRAPSIRYLREGARSSRTRSPRTIPTPSRPPVPSPTAPDTIAPTMNQIPVNAAAATIPALGWGAASTYPNREAAPKPATDP